jgi:hypothetical protein
MDMAYRLRTTLVGSSGTAGHRLMRQCCDTIGLCRAMRRLKTAEPAVDALLILALKKTQIA